MVLLAIVVLLPLYLVTATWDTLQSDDPWSTALAGWTAASTGSLAFNRNWERSSLPWPADGRDGRIYSNRFPGVIAVAAVGYAGAGAVGAIPMGPIDDPSDVPVWPATLMAVLIAVIAAVLTWRLLRFLPVSPRVALFSTAVVALGSPLWSVSATALWTHGATHALLAGVLILLIGGRVGWAALCAGIVVTFRPHLLIPVLVLAAAQENWGSRLALTAGSVLGVASVAVYSLLIFGQPLPAAGYRVDHVVASMPASSISSLLGNLGDWLTHRHRGVLTFVPILLVALINVRSAWRMAPRWVKASAIAGAAYAVVQLGLMRASGGNFFFGHRTTIEALVLALPLIVLSASSLVKGRGVLPRSLGRPMVTVAAGFSVIIHAYGAWIDLPPGVDDILRDYRERQRGIAVSLSVEEAETSALDPTPVL